MENQDQEINFEQIQSLEEEFIDHLKELLELVPEDYRGQFTENLIFHTVNYGSRDYYQALGILEEAKTSYSKSYKEIISEEHVCEDCNQEQESLQLQQGGFFKSHFNVDSKDIN